jgi:type IV pilus assembly protein PilX
MYRTYQTGGVLLVALVFLVALTLIGLTAMQGTTMEERMASNSRQVDVAFQAAEAALRDGEADLLNNSPTGYNSSCNNGLCITSTTGTPVWQSAAWGTTGVRTYGQYTGNSPLAGANGTTLLPQEPQYIIEQLPVVSPPGNDLSSPDSYGSQATIQYYRITAWGVGTDDSTISMVQSIYFPD